jgi:deazaflavin-dependent oxidoreductase (nitroreductase family)
VVIERADAAGPALAPTRGVALIRRLAGPIWLRVGIAALVDVPGRKTGVSQRVMVIPVDLDGLTYVLSFGGVTSWARNLRAAGRAQIRHKGRTREVNAIEVNGAERDRVIAKYLAGSGPIKKDFYRRPDHAEHPAFRMDPIS